MSVERKPDPIAGRWMFRLAAATALIAAAVLPTQSSTPGAVENLEPGFRGEHTANVHGLPTVFGAPAIQVEGGRVRLESEIHYTTSAAVTTHSFSLPAPAVANGRVEVIGEGDFAGLFDTAMVVADSFLLGTIGRTGNPCSTAFGRFDLTPTQLDFISQDGAVNVSVRNAATVTADCPVNRHYVSLEYDGPNALLDFGRVVLGETSELTINILNTGSADLATAVTTTGAEGFTPSVAALTVPPQGSQPLTITFAPVTVGPFAGTLTLESNDPLTPLLAIPLLGTGIVVPDVSVTPATLSESLFTGETSIQTLSLNNDDLGELLFELSVQYPGDSRSPGEFQKSRGLDLDWLSVSPATGNVPAGALLDVAVTFDATGLFGGTYAADILVISNDPDEPVVFVPVQLQVTGAPDIAIQGRTTVIESTQGFNLQGAATVHELPVSAPAPAGATFELTATGHFAEPDDTATAIAEGIPLASASGSGSSCSQARTTRQLTPELFEDLALDGRILVEVQNSIQVLPDVCPVNQHTVRFSYETPVDELAFGSMFLGVSRTITFDVANVGTDTLVVTSVASDVAEFLPTSTTVTVPPTETAPLSVTFTPSSVTEIGGTLTLTSNDPDTPVLTIPLSGSAVEPPVLAVEPASIATTLFTGGSETRTISVSNGGGSTLLASVNVSHAGPAFLAVDQPSIMVPPGRSLQLAVEFNATGFNAGTYEAAVEFQSNDPLTPSLAVPVTMGVIGAPDLSILGDAIVLESAIDYASSPGSTTHVFQIPPVLVDAVVDVRVDGDFGSGTEFASVAAEQFVLGAVGGAGSDCVPVDTAFPLSADDFWELTLDGTVTVVLINSSSVDLICDVNRHTVRVRYSGSAELLDFGTVFVGGTPTMAVRVVNSGTDVLEVSSIDTGAAEFTPALSALTLDPQQSQLLEVTFSPGAPGTFAASLTLQSNDPDTPVIEIGLTGAAIPAPVIAVQPSALEADLWFGTEDRRTLTVTNSGGNPLEFSIDVSSVVEPAGTTSAGTAGQPPETGDRVELLSMHSGSSPRGSADGDPPEFLRVTPLSGIVPVGESVDIDVLFDASELDPGFHAADIQVSSNDPVNPLVSIAAELKVRSRPILVLDGEDVVLESTLAYFSSGAVTEHSLDVDLLPDGAASVEVEINGDFGDTSETATVTAEGIVLGVVAMNGPDCTTQSATFDLTAGQLETLLEDGTVEFEVRNSTQVGDFCNVNQHTLRLRFDGVAEALDFGVLFIGQTRELTINVANPGSELLRVDASIDAVETEFTPLASTFDVEPGATHPLTVTCAPRQTGDVFGTLALQTNDPLAPQVEIVMKAEGLEAPEVSLTPTALVENLPTGGTSVRTVSIANSGGSDLVFSLGVGLTDPLPQGPDRPLIVNPPNPDARSDVPLETPEPNVGGPFLQPVQHHPAANGITSVLIVRDGLPWGSINANEQLLAAGAIGFDVIPASMLASTDLSDYRVVLVPSDQTSSFYASIAARESQLTDYVFAGGVLEFHAAGWGHAGGNASLVTLPGGMRINPRYAAVNFVLDGDHPLMAGVPNPFTGGSASHSYFSEVPASANVIASDDFGRPNLVVYRFGAGWVVSGGQTFEFGVVNGWPVGVILANMIPYSHSLGVDWLSVEPSSGRLAPGAAMDVTLTFDATGLDGGNYNAGVIATSNDPDQPEAALPTLLRVTGAPDIEVSSTSIDFGLVYLGDSATRFLTVSNVGTDLLTVDIATDGPPFTVEVGGVSLAQDESRALAVVFEPTALGTFNGLLVVQSNDPSNPRIEVPVGGTGDEPACGDGIVSDGEECDDGNDIDADLCGNDCALNFCGDGQVQPPLSETCDPPGLPAGQPDGCRHDCTFCGDGIVDMTSIKGVIATGEECDDGNNSDGDGCSADCRVELLCGNGVVDGTEECDDGNSTDDDACGNDCALNFCGDGQIQQPLGETCDPPGAPHGQPDECRDDCTFCGDGILDMTSIKGVIATGEECDDGNNADDDGCSSGCRIESCGDGIVNGTEECDDGNNTDGDGCDAQCRIEPACGDGIVSDGEECDDGNSVNDDDCGNDCTLNFCGDGAIQFGRGETCDPPGAPAGQPDECRDDCTFCGDGTVDMASDKGDIATGEECDDGNNIGGDGCAANCRIE